MLIDRSVLFKGGLFGLRGFGFLRLIGGRRFVLHKCSDIVKGFGALFLVRILPIKHNAGEKEKGGTYGRPDHQIFAFHKNCPPVLKLRSVPAAEHTLAGFRRHKLIQFCISRKAVDKGYKGAAVLDKTAACVRIGNIAHLLVGDVE